MTIFLECRSDFSGYAEQKKWSEYGLATVIRYDVVLATVVLAFLPAGSDFTTWYEFHGSVFNQDP